MGGFASSSRSVVPSIAVLEVDVAGVSVRLAAALGWILLLADGDFLPVSFASGVMTFFTFLEASLA